MTTTDANQLIADLYRAVDNKDLAYLAQIMAEDVNFRIGNHPQITDKAEALAANSAFFESIRSMRHRIDKVWAQGGEIWCHGDVDYVRLDGTGHSAHFATLLVLRDGLIGDYLVFADLSGL